MKKVLYTATVISILALSSSLYADSVAVKEAQAIANSKMTEGVAAAKAKVEEASDKLMFKTKMDREKFEKEAKEDKTKELNSSNQAESKVKSFEKNEQQKALKKEKSFIKDAEKDIKKSIK